MKKMLFATLLFVFFLIGCDANRLLAPQDIRVVDDLLLWEEVEGASSYLVIINEEEYSTEETSYDLSAYLEGSYQIYIKSLRGNQSSKPSALFLWTKEAVDYHITNLRQNDNGVSWDSLGSGLHYIVLLRDQEYQVSSNQFVYHEHDILPNQTFTIGVRADKDNSPISELYVEYYTLTDEVTRDFHTTTTDDLLFLFTLEQALLHQVYLEEESVALDIFHIMGDDLYIEVAYLLTFDQDITLRVDTSLGRTFVGVHFVEERMPHIVSSTTLTYLDGEDIVVLFRLYLGQFDGLVGNDISQEDYIEEDGTLTIYSSFLDAILEVNPDRKTVILQYNLSLEDRYTWGYLIIHLQ